MEHGEIEGLGEHALDRRSLLKKLAAGGTVVWTAPMIASRASALMPPSLCVNGAVLNWTNLFPSTTPDFGDGPATFFDVDGSGVDITISSTIQGTVALARNYEVQDSPHGGITGKSLRFDQRPVPNTPSSGGTSQAGGQTITIFFSTTVRNISFTITDIDNENNTWSDRITTITAPTSFTRGTNIIGIGATGNGTNNVGDFSSTNDGNGGSNVNTGAFRNNIELNLADTSGNGNLTLNYAGPIDTVTFRWWCGGEGAGINSSNQRINLSNITFDTCPEGVTPGLAPSPAPVQSELRVPALDDEPVGPNPPGVD